MKIPSGFFVYKVYITYKAHFSYSNTNIAKYNFKNFNVSYNSYVNTKGKHYYIWLGQKLRNKMMVVNFFITAFIDDRDHWIGTISDNYEELINQTHSRLARLNNIEYIFKKDSIYLLDTGMKFDNTIGDFVLSAFVSSKISLETFIIFRRLFNFNLDNNPNYNYLYKVKYEKYEKLISINTDTYKQILKEVIM
jgi:hypothetical protein